MAFTADTVPTFASARAADVILSDVRPTSITPDALRAVNILLDELLWLVLANARSLDISRLKTGVLKTIPTQLGKDAILEAEIEIRAYRDKTHSRPRSVRPTEDILAAFPLQEAFEFLRLKCQVLSSFGEIEEDPVSENQLLENYRAVSPLSPSQDFTEPAPLYITAVIEHVCQHVLANIAQVVARDSSRTSADLVILYTSLCEDSSIYPVFKTMKVQGHIQSRIRPDALVNSQSVTQPEDASRSRSTTSATVLKREASTHRGVPRPSAESTQSSSVRDANNNSGKRSTERSRVMRIFRQSPDANDEPNDRRSGPHQRSESMSEAGGRIVASPDQSSVGEKDRSFASDDGNAHFEELLDSGSTMKVSLTPDRLKTFEVFSKEKTLRLNRAAASNSDSLSRGKDEFNLGPTDTKPKIPLIQRRPVGETFIDEDEELPDGSGAQSRARAVSLAHFIGKNAPDTLDAPAVPGHASNGSISQNKPLPPHHKSTESIPPRPRAATVDLGVKKQRTRKMSLKGPFGSGSGAITEDTSSQPLPSVSPKVPSTPFTGSPAFSGTRLRKAKPARARNRDSLDLDEIMGGDNDDVDAEGDGSGSGEDDQIEKPSLGIPQPKAKFQLKSPTTNGPSTTRDILQFLDEGPPDVEYASSVASASVSHLSTRSKGGRLMSMVSKLRRGGSNEKVGRSPTMDKSASDTAIFRSISIGPSATPSTLGVPPMRRPKSNHNLAASNRLAPSSWIPPTPPPPPPPPRPEPLGAVTLSPSKAAKLPSPTASPPPTKDTFSALVDPVSIPSLPSPVSMQFKAAVASPSRKNSLTRKPVPALILTPQEASDEFDYPAPANAGVVTQTTQTLPSRSPLRTMHSERKNSSERTHVNAISNVESDNPTRFSQPHTPTSPNTPSKFSTSPTLIPKNGSASRTPSPVDLDKTDQAVPSVPPEGHPTSDGHPGDRNSADWMSRAAELRQALAAAQHVDEARLLVDMFFTRWGISTREPEPEPLPPNKETLVDFSPSLPSISDQDAVIEALLGDGDIIVMEPSSC